MNYSSICRAPVRAALAVAVTSLFAGTGAATAQSYPTKNVTIIVPLSLIHI